MNPLHTQPSPPSTEQRVQGILTVHPGFHGKLVRSEISEIPWIANSELRDAQGHTTWFPTSTIIGGREITPGVYKLKGAVLKGGILDLSQGTTECESLTGNIAMSGVSQRFLSKAANGKDLIAKPLENVEINPEATKLLSPEATKMLGITSPYDQIKAMGADAVSLKALLVLPGHSPVLLTYTEAFPFKPCLSEQQGEGKDRSTFDQQCEDFRQQTMRIARECGIEGWVPESFVIFQCCPQATLAPDTLGKGIREKVENGETVQVAFLHSSNGNAWPVEVAAGQDIVNPEGYSASILNISTSPEIPGMHKTTFTLPEKPLVLAIQVSYEEPSLKGGLMRKLKEGLKESFEKFVLGEIPPRPRPKT